MLQRRSAPAIIIRGARQNNLKNLSLELPTNELLVVTGVSGSGKSSLVFDTLYAEGQRRYVETFSPYARQFLDRMDKPQVDAIEGIPPAIAIDQTNPVRTSRSTVGTTICPPCSRCHAWSGVFFRSRAIFISFFLFSRYHFTMAGSEDSTFFFFGRN